MLRNGSLGRGWDAAGGGTLDFYAPHGYPYWGGCNALAFPLTVCGMFAVSRACLQKPAQARLWYTACPWYERVRPPPVPSDAHAAGHDSITRLISPFHVPAQQYQLDKPALVGEFWDQVRVA